MRNMRKKFSRSFIGSMSVVIGCIFLTICTLSSSTFAMDLLEQSFQQSKQYDTVVDVGNNKNAVGNEIIRGGTTINLGGGGPIIQQQDPLLVKIIKRMLRMMAIVGVSMGIYIGITYILAQGDEGKEKTARENLVKIAVGIIIALSAIALVNLIQSISRSSINL